MMVRDEIYKLSSVTSDKKSEIQRGLGKHALDHTLSIKSNKNPFMILVLVPPLLFFVSTNLIIPYPCRFIHPIISTTKHIASCILLFAYSISTLV